MAWKAIQFVETLIDQENEMDDEDSDKKCLSTQHGTDINIIKLSYNSPPVSEEVERFKLMRSVFNRVFV